MTGKIRYAIAKLHFFVLKFWSDAISKQVPSYRWYISKEQVSMTPKVLSEIHWKEKNYYYDGKFTGKKWTEIHLKSRRTLIINK